MASLLRRVHKFQQVFPVRNIVRNISRMSTPYLLTPRQLEELGGTQDRVVVLDVSWEMPNSPRKPKDEFLAKRLPGARFLDLDEVASEHELGLKHMMPSARTFAEACEHRGIDPSTHVVLYDGRGVFSSPRALFMFRAFGHHKSSILDGGLPRWEAENLPISNNTHPAGDTVQKTSYPTPSFDESVVKSYAQMVSNADCDPLTETSAELVVDARSAGRFTGKDPEPRPGLSSGHIPYSHSLPFNAFLETHASPVTGENYTTFRSSEDLRKALVEAIGRDNAEQVIKGERSITTTCGSGMTAGVLWLGLKLLGADNVGLYDESWTGYASRESSKIEKSI